MGGGVQVNEYIPNEKMDFTVDTTPIDWVQFEVFFGMARVCNSTACLVKSKKDLFFA